MTSLPGHAVLRVGAQGAEAVVIVDAAGTVCSSDDGAVRILGSGPEAVLGSTLAGIIPERLRRRCHGALRAVMARRSARDGASDPVAVPARHADGPPVSIEFNVVLYDADAGSVGNVASIPCDAAARRAREQELRWWIEAFEAAGESP